jgi:hypothetical protein
MLAIGAGGLEVALALTDLWLPPARLRHPLPDVRFSVMTVGGA